jgi:hypothetical protein
MFKIQPFRVAPKLPASERKTYTIKQHFRSATCAEVECEPWRNGWTSTFDVSTALGAEQADYVRARSGRAFTVAMIGATLLQFTFKPGQPCFGRDAHRLPVERTPLFVVRDGDYRGNPRGTPAVRRRPQDWVEDFALHQGALAERRQRG